MKLRHEHKIQMVPIHQISVINSRTRGMVKFKQIIANIGHLGLKKPITVAPRNSRDGESGFELVCGEGRLLALKALGQTEAPVAVVHASKIDLLLAGLAENIARRAHATVELAKQIVEMRDRGYKPSEIAKKVDLDVVYVNGIIRLLKHGEERLLAAVERRQIPLSVAITIAESSDRDVQRAMKEAYDRGDLRGKALLRARRLIEQRRNNGKGRRNTATRQKPVTGNTLVKAYKREAARQQMALSRARLCETRLRFVVSAIKKLLADDSFVNLLRAEGLATLPCYLVDQLNSEEV